MKNVNDLTLAELKYIIISDGYEYLPAATQRAIVRRFELLSASDFRLHRPGNVEIAITAPMLERFPLMLCLCARCAKDKCFVDTEKCELSDNKCPAARLGGYTAQQVKLVRMAMFTKVKPSKKLREDEVISKYFSSRPLNDWDSLELLDLALPENISEQLYGEMAPSAATAEDSSNTATHDNNSCNALTALRHCRYSGELCKVLRYMKHNYCS